MTSTVTNVRWLLIFILVVYLPSCALSMIEGAFEPSTIDRIDSLVESARQYAIRGDFLSANRLLEAAVTDAEKTGLKEREGQVLLILGEVAYTSRDFHRAEVAGKKALDIFQSVQPSPLLATAYTTWGTAIWAQSRFDEAIGAFEKALQLYSVAHDTTGMSSANCLLALSEEERGNYEKSFQYSMQAMAYKDPRASIALGQLYADVGDYNTALLYYSRITEDPIRMANYLKVGEVYFLKNDYDSALYFYKKFLSGSRRDDKVRAKPYVLMGELYLAQKKYDSALYYLKIALTEFSEVNDRNWTMRSLLELGKAYRDLNEPKQALAYTQELLTSASESGAKQFSRDAHYLLYELFARLHNIDSAYIHLKKYTELNRSIAIEVSAQKLGFYKASALLEDAKFRINLLDRQRQLQEEETTQEARQKWMLVAAILLLMIVFIIVARNFFLKRKNAEHLQQLAASELEIEKLQHTRKLSELEMQVLRTQMNPHFIFNSLTSINRFILRNDQSEAISYLTKLSRLVRMILQNSQYAVITLDDEIQCLTLYLELEKLRFDNQFNYKITMDENVDATITKVPPLIIQPFVENAIWHGIMPKGGGGIIRVHISTDDANLYITISDDGVGRQASASRQQMQASTHRSLGLKITSQRINMMNKDPQVNSVEIKDLIDASGVAAGTEVNIKLPLSQ